jgi:hypothetical protein
VKTRRLVSRDVILRLLWFLPVNCTQTRWVASTTNWAQKPKNWSWSCIGKRIEGHILLIYWTYPGQQLTVLLRNISQPRKGRRKLFTARDEVGLNRLGKKNRQSPMQEITTKFNNSKQHSFTSRTIRRKLAFEGYKWRAAKKCFIIRVKKGWHGVGKNATGLLIRTGGNIFWWKSDSCLIK